MEDYIVPVILAALAYIVYKLFIDGGNDDKDN